MKAHLFLIFYCEKFYRFQKVLKTRTSTLQQCNVFRGLTDWTHGLS